MTQAELRARRDRTTFEQPDPSEDLLPFSRMPAWSLPTLAELGLELGQMSARPFGRDEQGRIVESPTGPILGLIAAVREVAAERVESDLPAEMPPNERSARVVAEQERMLDKLVEKLNAAQPDPRYRVTKEYLENPRNRFSYEFWTFMAHYTREITGDREIIFRAGTHSIPSSVIRLARAFGVEGTYRALARLSNLVTRNDIETVATTSTSAVIRWPSQYAMDVLPASVVPAYRALACQGFRGGLAALPEVIAGLPRANVTQPQCRVLGADYCLWEFTWEPVREGASWRTLALSGALSASVVAASTLKGRLPHWVVTIVGAVLPLLVARDRVRMRRLQLERDEEHRLLVEQRDVAEHEYNVRSQALLEMQDNNLQLARRVAELTTVNQVGHALSKTVDLDTLLRDSLEAIVRHAGYERAVVFLHDEKRNALTTGHMAGGSAQDVQWGESYEVDLARTGSLFAQIFHSEEPVLVTDVFDAGDERAKQIAAAVGATSFLGTPLITQGRKLGILAVDHGRSGRVPDEADKSLIFTLGSLIATAIETSGLYRELEQRVEQRTEQLARAKEDAEAARQQAEHANEAKSRFLSNVSHELRTPLTSVLGFAKIIAERLDSTILPATNLSDPKRERAARQVRDNLGIIVAEGERLTAMINNVLDLAKIESGKFEWKDDEIAVPSLLAQAGHATSSLFEAKSLELRTEIADDLPVIRGDRDRLLQVVINLLSNAVKFTDEGFVRLAATSSDSELLISVTDTGTGIAPADHAAVFEQFRQVGDTLTHKPTGTGLGLPISKEIVEHHGGRMWLDSELGKGSTFWFSLPVKRAELTGGDQTNGHRPHVPRDGRQLVLVVDDDASTRELLRQELEAREYAVIEAVDGRGALAGARNSKPALIILDVVIPEPDGFDVAAALKADPGTAPIPIVMVTVLDAAERARQVGAESFVGKPFDEARLMAEVERLAPPVKSSRRARPSKTTVTG